MFSKLTLFTSRILSPTCKPELSENSQQITRMSLHCWRQCSQSSHCSPPGYYHPLVSQSYLKTVNRLHVITALLEAMFSKLTLFTSRILSPTCRPELSENSQQITRMSQHCWRQCSQSSHCSPPGYYHPLVSQSYLKTVNRLHVCHSTAGGNVLKAHTVHLQDIITHL